MIHHLARYGQVTGVDNNPRPLAIAQQRGYDVRQGGAEALPVDGDSFDLVALLDTLEHCQDDMAVLRECRRACAPGGYLVVTTPAFMALWSHNDELNRHYRRYTGSELRRKLAAAGFAGGAPDLQQFSSVPPCSGADTAAPGDGQAARAGIAPFRRRVVPGGDGAGATAAEHAPQRRHVDRGADTALDQPAGWDVADLHRAEGDSPPPEVKLSGAVDETEPSR